MIDEFDEMYPDFDPASFTKKYPSSEDFPGLFWQEAMRRVYDHELYAMARDPEYEEELRSLARAAWVAIEQDDVNPFVRNVAGQLWDSALVEDDLWLSPLRVSAYMSIMLWAGFREATSAGWAQHVLHSAIGLINHRENSILTISEAFAAGYA